MNTSEIVEVLQDWLKERCGEIVDPALPFAEGDLLDSFDVLELVVFSETRFNIKFSARDFASPDFSVLAGLARVIQSRI